MDKEDICVFYIKGKGRIFRFFKCSQREPSKSKFIITILLCNTFYSNDSNTKFNLKFVKNEWRWFPKLPWLFNASYIVYEIQVYNTFKETNCAQSCVPGAKVFTLGLKTITQVVQFLEKFTHLWIGVVSLRGKHPLSATVYSHVWNRTYNNKS